MHVSDYTIGMAVLRVFRDNRVFDAGGSLLLSTLNLAWDSTGLRQRDLRRGIETLRQSGCVSVNTYRLGYDILVTLQPDGAARLTEFPHRFAEWIREICGLLVLRSANRRNSRC